MNSSATLWRAVAFLALLASNLLAPSPVAARSPGSAPFEGRWIDVDVANLVITAYEGNRAVYVASFSGGRLGWDTPEGTFPILRRLESDDLDSATVGIPRDGPGGYYLRDVRYVQYLTSDGVALHEDYWSWDATFGRQNSTLGCISLRNADAAYFWEFAGLGTPVVIHRPGEGPMSQALAQGRPRSTRGGFQLESGSQPPEEGEEGAAGAAPNSLGTRVPQVVGLPEAEARSLIEQAGLRSGEVGYQSESYVPEEALAFFLAIEPGHVVSARPKPGTQVAEGSVVRVNVRAE